MIVQVVKILFFPIIFIFLTECKSVHQTETSQPYIILEKTSCLGPCPTYQIQINQKESFLNGISNLPLVGNFSTKTPIETWQNLEPLFAKAPEMSSAYKSTYALDLPTTYLKVFDGSKLYETSIYGDEPKLLKNYLTTIDSLVNAEIWNAVK